MPKVNLVIDQGTDFNTIIQLTDENNDLLNVTGYVARGQLRKHYYSNTATSFTTSLATGELRISLNASQTANITPGRYVYDVELTDPSNTRIRILEGIASVQPEVTKI